jgi:hypothetical protein
MRRVINTNITDCILQTSLKPNPSISVLVKTDKNRKQRPLIEIWKTDFECRCVEQVRSLIPHRYSLLLLLVLVAVVVLLALIKNNGKKMDVFKLYL